MAYVAIADRDAHLHDPETFITKYIWSQDHKVIAVQYAITAILVGVVALVLSLLFRLQLGFPDTFSLVDPNEYYQYVTMHGMIMVIYLLTALFLGGFGNYLIPLMCGARDMVFPYMNMLSFWVYLLSVIVLLASFFVPGGPTGAGWTLYPPQAISPGTPGIDGGIVLMLVSLAIFIVAFTMGGAELTWTHGAAGARAPRHDADAHAALGVGHLRRDHPGPARVPGAARGGHHAAAGPVDRHEFLHAGDAVHGRKPRLRRRQPDPLPAPVLVLRPPGGLHRCPAGFRHRFRRAERARAKEYIRLSHDGVGHRRHRRAELRGLGAPYVCERHEPVLRFLLRHHDADHCRTHGAEGLQLDPDAVAGRHSPARPDAVRHRLYLHLHPRRADRAVPGQTSPWICRSRIPTSSSDTSTW